MCGIVALLTKDHKVLGSPGRHIIGIISTSSLGKCNGLFESTMTSPPIMVHLSLFSNVQIQILILVIEMDLDI